MKKIIATFFMLLIPVLAYAQPEIRFDAEMHDLGEVKNEIVSHSFEFKNTGSSELIIEKLVPSWGCTAALASSGRIKPGEQGKISTTVDVRGKIGKISKTVHVHSNDPKRPQITLVLTMKVNDALHTKKHTAIEIFKSPCAKCHIDEGKGKKGIALFNADCIMCHNYNKSASPLNVLRDMPDDKLRQAIEDGVKGTSMPGWINSKNGPLTSEEIISLIEFIKGHK